MNRRWPVYAALFAAALLLRNGGADIGKLCPVEALAVEAQDGQVLLTTDTGDCGAGQNLEEAIENLKATTDGVVFLDTAKYLLIAPGAEEQALELNEFLKGNVRVCYASDGITPEDAARYLAAHPPEMYLRDYYVPAPAQTLRTENGRLILQ